MKCLVKLEEIVNVVSYLVSDVVVYIIGEILLVNGGLYMC